MTMWIYRKNKDKGGDYYYTVGYFVPYDEGSGMAWEPIEDFRLENDARHLVHYLNGGNSFA
jgi:hypothetical protein